MYTATKSGPSSVFESHEDALHEELEDSWGVSEAKLHHSELV